MQKTFGELLGARFISGVSAIDSIPVITTTRRLLSKCGCDK